eukprot:scaffold34905_cov64-Phaeocystis_antarctica.AAC.3
MPSRCVTISTRTLGDAASPVDAAAVAAASVPNAADAAPTAPNAASQISASRSAAARRAAHAKKPSYESSRARKRVPSGQCTASSASVRNRGAGRLGRGGGSAVAAKAALAPAPTPRPRPHPRPFCGGDIRPVASAAVTGRKDSMPFCVTAAAHSARPGAHRRGSPSTCANSAAVWTVRRHGDTWMQEKGRLACSRRSASPAVPIAVAAVPRPFIALRGLVNTLRVAQEDHLDRHAPPTGSESAKGFLAGVVAASAAVVADILRQTCKTSCGTILANRDQEGARDGLGYARTIARPEMPHVHWGTCIAERALVPISARP